MITSAAIAWFYGDGLFIRFHFGVLGYSYYRYLFIMDVEKTVTRSKAGCGSHCLSRGYEQVWRTYM